MARTKSNEFNDDELRAYMAVSPKKKLEHLEEMNQFLKKIRPEKSKRIAQKLALEGF